MAWRESEGRKQGVLRFRVGMLLTTPPAHHLGRGLSDGAASITDNCCYICMVVIL